ncbi:predicted protein [Sclerotinia sclerotiorum 1980 UF-70]|uniref:Uncharacterized protein n=1 Tax=Sclerotinia sclerotiorum (strain ATCC 18683 / 1980 / Ss-1) TaxID=665079 RepID=A7F8Y3_SCLS1|nr:predicted protein [Sclerotinia sclerotiorum 1980 UF-70]EDN99204.1 predicted protein [Sclerotinia sclerotiorum 1980 UF-70]
MANRRIKFDSLQYRMIRFSQRNEEKMDSEPWIRRILSPNIENEQQVFRCLSMLFSTVMPSCHANLRMPWKFRGICPTLAKRYIALIRELAETAPPDNDEKTSNRNDESKDRLVATLIVTVHKSKSELTSPAFLDKSLSS